MKYCAYCGKELLDEAEFCVGCGQKVNKTSEVMEVKKENNAKKVTKAGKIWIISGVILAVIGIISAILFAPRNLKMDDFKDMNVVSAIIQYGIPEKVTTNEEYGVCFQYGDKHDFYGITPFTFTVYPEENRVAFLFGSDDGYDVYKKIDRYCDFEKNLLDAFHKFSYGNIEITTYDYDGSYVNIEID